MGLVGADDAWVSPVVPGALPLAHPPKAGERNFGSAYPNLLARPHAPNAGRGRLQTQIRRAFETSRGVLSTSQIFDWTYASHRAYGQRIPCWHRWSVSRILRQIAEPIGRADTIGRPWLWRLRDPAVQKPSEN